MEVEDLSLFTDEEGDTQIISISVYAVVCLNDSDGGFQTVFPMTELTVINKNVVL